MLTASLLALPAGAAQLRAQDTLQVQPSPAPPGDTAVSPLTAQQGAEPDAAEGGLIGTADRYVGVLNGALATVFFWDVLFWDPAHALPLVVLWLILGATYLTLRMKFINLRGFRHAVDVTRGDVPLKTAFAPDFAALSVNRKGRTV